MSSAARRGSQTDVLRLITRLNVGGPARHALLLTRALAESFPTTLAAGRCLSHEGELSDPSVVVRRVPLIRPIRPHSDVHAVVAIRRLMRETRPQLMHTHMSKAGAVGRLAAITVNPRPRTIHTFHGHVLAGYFSNGAEKAFIEVERRLARLTDVLVAVSPEVRDALLDLGIGREDQFRVIPVGLDLAPFLAVTQGTGKLRHLLGLGPEVPLVGVVGRLVPIKDIDTLLRAVSQLPSVHVAVIGDGEQRKELELRARAMGMGARAHFTGWCHDLPSALSDVDVVALTSRNEGVPTALIQASAAGKPAVATNVGGVPSVVKDGVTGYLVAPADHVGVAARLNRLLGDVTERTRFGDAARRHAARSFGQQRLLADVGDLYNEMLVSRLTVRSSRMW